MRELLKTQILSFPQILSTKMNSKKNWKTMVKAKIHKKKSDR